MSGTNPVATYGQTNNTTQNASAYKAQIDSNSIVAQRVVDQFAPRQTSTPAMTITVDAGCIFLGTTLTEVAAQTSGTITAPSSGNKRIDRAVVNTSTGTLSIITGTPTTGTPSAPAITAGNMPVAQISLTSSTTTITNSIITDERNFWSPPFTSSPTTNSLGSDVTLNNTTTYFDGPSVAQGTSGTWFASGTVTVLGNVDDSFDVKLWDGTTVIASTQFFSVNSSQPVSISLSGYLSSPAGNLKISVKDTGSTSGAIKYNSSGNSKDSTITAIRIG